MHTQKTQQTEAKYELIDNKQSTELGFLELIQHSLNFDDRHFLFMMLQT